MEILVKITGIVGVLFITALLYALPVMWLWDWLMPVLFELKKITLLQALGVSMLSSVLFKSSNSK